MQVSLGWDKWTLHWRHNDHDGVSNHQPRGCLLNRLFRRRSKKTSKLRVTGFSAGNSPVTGEFPTQRASNENVSIWWRHHEYVAWQPLLGFLSWFPVVWWSQSNLFEDRVALSNLFWVKWNVWLHGYLYIHIYICHHHYRSRICHYKYRQISNIRCTNSQNVNISPLVLQLSSPNPLKPDFKLRMEMQLEQRRQAMLQLHLSNQRFYCPLRCHLY